MLLLDLDNTLVDRDAAFRHAAADFLAAHDLPASDLTWLTAADAGGCTARDEPADAMTDRYGDADRPPPSEPCSTPAPPTASAWRTRPAGHW